MTLNNVRSSPNLVHWCEIWVGRGCMTAIIYRFLLTILWEIVTSVWELYMLKSNIDVFFVTSFLCSLQFLLFHLIGHTKRYLQKKWKFSVAQFLWYDCTLQKPMYRPCDLDLWPMKVNYFLLIDYQPISVLYKFEIDTSTNSREIKYLNIEIWV